ncbi:hypothetical protein C2R93_04385 [Helicobacter pylori]|nr:hypothetical protein C2R93_04385 [Helicobacter pylori]
MMNATKSITLLYLGQRSYAFKDMMREANTLEIKICKIPMIRDTE